MTAPSSPVRRPGAFAALLRGLREAAGLTQAELADRSGVGVRTVSNLERGINRSPYPSTVRLLAEALDADGPARAELLRAARRDPGAARREPVAPLVGREPELAAIAEALAAAADGSGHVVLLAGEPGIGKTRLVQEAIGYAEERGFLVAAGRCYEPQRETPLAPLLDVVTALYDALAPTVRGTLVDRWPALTTLLPDHFPSVPPAGPAPDAGQRLQRAVTGLVRELADERPVALLVDDLHWADAATVELLTHLARHTGGSPVLLLGTHREAEVGEGHPVRRLGRSLRREGLVRMVPVRRLDQDATTRLVASRLASASVPEALGPLVHRHTDGNPFFVVETLTTLIERGDLTRVDGRWTGEPDALAVPSSVSEAIDERVSRLAAATRAVLEASSVLGDMFDVGDLPVPGADERGLESALDEAVGSGLLGVVEVRYAFDHSLTRQTLYAGLPPVRLRRLHREVGEILERRSTAVHRRRAAEIARHLEAGGAPERAVPFLLLAGQVAAGLHAPGEALRHYRRALDLAEEVGDEQAAAAALEGTGQVETAIAAYDDAVDHLAGAADRYRLLGDTGGALRAEGQVAQAQYRRGEGEAGAVRLAEVVADVEERLGPDGRLPGLWAMYLGLGSVRLALGQRQQCLDAAEQAARLARQEHAVAGEADAEALRGTSLLFLDRPDEAVRVLERAIGLAAREDATTVESGATLALHWTLTMRGELDRARAVGERGLALARRAGTTDAQALHLANLGMTAFYRGDWAEAQDHLETSMELAGAGARTLFSGIPPAYLGVLRAAQGDRPAAEAAFAAAAAAPDLLTFEFGAYVETRRAALDLDAGEPAAALARLASWLGAEAPTRIHDVMLMSVAAEACLVSGDLDRAEELVARALRRADATRNVIDGIEALRLDAGCLAARGRHDDARTRLEQALAQAVVASYPRAEDRVRADLASLGRS